MAPRTRARVVNGQIVQEPVDAPAPASPAGDDASDDSKLQMRNDGSLRRSAGGGRSFGEYFSEAHRHKPIARGELLGFMEWFCWSQRHGTWYRRLWRWLNRTPGPMGRGPGVFFADAYEERQFKPTVNKVQAALEKQKRPGADV